MAMADDNTKRDRDARGDRYDRRASYQPHTLGKAPKAQRKPISVANARAGQTITALGDAHAVIAVPDPYDPAARIQATVHRNVDVLEYERSRNFITVSEYETGRIVQAVLERAEGSHIGSPGFEPSGSRDVTLKNHLRMARNIDDARVVRDLMAKIEGAVGASGARALRAFLTHEQSFAAYAAARGKESRREVGHVAWYFRSLLQAVDEAFAAHGARNTVERAFRGAAESVSTDERGRVVPKGQGFRFGGDEGDSNA
jgi:hypothetical protein